MSEHYASPTFADLIERILDGETVELPETVEFVRIPDVSPLHEATTDSAVPFARDR